MKMANHQTTPGPGVSPLKCYFLLTAFLIILMFNVSASATICSSDDWCWQTPSPQGQDLRSVWGLGKDNVFAVGAGGTILHYDGQIWSKMESGVRTTLNDIWGSREDNIFAIGSDGLILHYDGNTWSVMESGTTWDLHSIHGSSDINIYAVGENGTILSLAENGWEKVNVENDVGYIGDTFQGVWTESSNTVFVAGSGHKFLYFDGDTWVDLSSGNVTSMIFDITATDKSNVYLAGYYHIVRFDGTVVHDMETGYDSFDNEHELLEAIWVAREDRGIAVGHDGRIMLYDGTQWQTETPVTEKRLYGVWGSDANDVYAVGEEGTILHFNGVEWSAMSSAVTYNELYDVWGTDLNNVFAVGFMAEILHYDGSEWSLVHSENTFTIRSIWGMDSNDVYAVGWGNLLLHFDGHSWEKMTFSGSYSTELAGVWGTDSTNVYAVGGSGVIFHYGGEDPWIAQESNTRESLTAVWGSDSANIYATGTNGTILHYDGVAWSTMDTPTQLELKSVWGTNADNVYAVGDSGIILHFDGSSWKILEQGRFGRFSDVFGTGKNDIYAVGRGIVLHFNGVSWREISSGAGWTSLNAVWSSGDRKFIVGDSGLILYKQDRQPGDVNGDNTVTLADVVLSLQVGTGKVLPKIVQGADVSGDYKIGIEEAIYGLGIISEDSVPQ